MLLSTSSSIHKLKNIIYHGPRLGFLFVSMSLGARFLYFQSLAPVSYFLFLFLLTIRFIAHWNSLCTVNNFKLIFNFFFNFIFFYISISVVFPTSNIYFRLKIYIFWYCKKGRCMFESLLKRKQIFSIKSNVMSSSRKTIFLHYFLDFPYYFVVQAGRPGATTCFSKNE